MLMPKMLRARKTRHMLTNCVIFSAFKHTDPLTVRGRSTLKYGERQIKKNFSLFSCVYSRVELFVFAMSRPRPYSIFVCSIYMRIRGKEQTSCLTSLMSFSLGKAEY